MKNKKKPPTNLGDLIEQVGMTMHVVSLLNERMDNLEKSFVGLLESLKIALGEAKE